MQLEEWRKKNRLSYEQLGNMLGHDDAYIRRVVKKKHRISLVLALKIECVTNGDVVLYDLLQDEEFEKVREIKKRYELIYERKEKLKKGG